MKACRILHSVGALLFPALRPSATNSRENVNIANDSASPEFLKERTTQRCAGWPDVPMGLPQTGNAQ